MPTGQKNYFIYSNYNQNYEIFLDFCELRMLKLALKLFVYLNKCTKGNLNHFKKIFIMYIGNPAI